MRRALLLQTAMILTLTACGGGDPAAEVEAAAGGDAVTGGQDGGGSSGGAVVNPQPPGQAAVMVDGLDLSFDQPGGIGCTLSAEAITFSFRIGDNEVTLGGGANHYEDQGWLGGIQMIVFNPEGGGGPVTYYPDLAVNGDRLAIDGQSLSYAGPMLMQPSNEDGTIPEPVDVGEGTISLTCP
jgi:hypothetical protein